MPAPETSPLDDLAPLEVGLIALFFGKVTGGIFGQVRQPPKSREFLRRVAAGDSAGILSGRWWRGIWSRALDSVQPALIRISRESGVAAFREIAASFSEARARELAVNLARERSAALLVQLERFHRHSPLEGRDGPRRPRHRAHRPPR